MPVPASHGAGLSGMRLPTGTACRAARSMGRSDGLQPVSGRLAALSGAGSFHNAAPARRKKRAEIHTASRHSARLSGSGHRLVDSTQHAAVALTARPGRNIPTPDRRHFGSNDIATRTLLQHNPNPVLRRPFHIRYFVYKLDTSLQHNQATACFCSRLFVYLPVETKTTIIWHFNAAS